MSDNDASHVMPACRSVTHAFDLRLVSFTLLAFVVTSVEYRQKEWFLQQMPPYDDWNKVDEEEEEELQDLSVR